MLSDKVEALFTTLTSAKVTLVEKPWGRERIVNCGEFLLKVIEVDAGKRTSLQYHERKEEVIVPLSGFGEGHIVIDRQQELPSTRDTVRIAPHTLHRAVGPLIMLEITTPENEDVVRVEDDYKR